MKTLRERIIEFEIKNPKLLHKLGIILAILLGIIILINVGLFFKNNITNIAGSGFSIANAKKLAGFFSVLLFVGVLVFNITKGTFSVTKFFRGFNPFAGAVQGKLIYYAILAILGYGLFHQLTRATYDYDTDYKNNIKNNRDVYIDQRVGDVCIEKCFVSIQPFGITILKVGCVKSCESSITQQTKIDSNDIKKSKKKERNNMPYISATDGRREALRNGEPALTAGELNYQIFYFFKHNSAIKRNCIYGQIKTFVANFLGEKPNYQKYNDMTGALIRCYKEIKRRLGLNLKGEFKEIMEYYDETIADYEDLKIYENGDVE